eukprot:jgi/Phyca11/99229/e_gw1.3.1137.1
MTNASLLTLVELRHQKQRNHQQRRRLAHKIAVLLRVRMTLRVRNYFTSNVLISPTSSPWATVYKSRNYGVYINIISLPVAAFEGLLLVFSRHYTVKRGPGKRGRSRRFQSKNNVLACILHFYTAAVEQKTLCELFGAVPSTLLRVLSKAETALEKALKDLPDTRIQWPSLDQQHRWAAAVTRKEPLIEGCFCVADGKNYAVQELSAATTLKAASASDASPATPVSDRIARSLL